MEQQVPQPEGVNRIAPYAATDFHHSPMLVFYEVTQACDLACRHCRACAQSGPHPEELRTDQAKALITQFASFPRRPLLVLTGGDPLKRPDIDALVRHAAKCRLEIAMTPSATPLATASAIARLRDMGVGRFAVSLDSSDEATHDAFRGVPGSFSRTLEIMRDARALGVPVQVNTTISRRNVHQVDAMADLIAAEGIVLWSVFFLIPVGRGAVEERIRAEEYEEVFEKLWSHAQRQRYAIKTTEAHHYRRFVLQRRGDSRLNAPSAESAPRDAGSGDSRRRTPLGINDGRGVLFVSHTGRVFPSGFLPLECGRFPSQSVVEIYQRHPVFLSLREPDQLHGKCGVCEFRQVCGGSRARAYAVTGDVLGPEPDCAYVPAKWTSRRDRPGNSGSTCLGKGPVHPLVPSD